MHRPTSNLSVAFAAIAILTSTSCGGGGTNPGLPITAEGVIGSDHPGDYHLGPVDWAESQWHNACAPYPSHIRTITGDMLAGVSNTIAAPGSLCDACIEVTTGTGKSEILRVVTYGVSNATGDLDLSPEAYAALTSGEFPRSMSWHLVACDNGAPLFIQFQTQASQWWTSFWVRNPSMAIDHVAVQSANHPTFTNLTRGTDGTFTDVNGFGAGAFTLRVVGVTGASIDIPFTGVTAGALVEADGNIPLP